MLTQFCTRIEPGRAHDFRTSWLINCRACTSISSSLMRCRTCGSETPAARTSCCAWSVPSPSSPSATVNGGRNRADAMASCRGTPPGSPVQQARRGGIRAHAEERQCTGGFKLNLELKLIIMMMDFDTRRDYPMSWPHARTDSRQRTMEGARGWCRTRRRSNAFSRAC